MTNPEQTGAPAKPKEADDEAGKRAKELQQEPPPPGQEQLPPTDPAGEPQLA